MRIDRSSHAGSLARLAARAAACVAASAPLALGGCGKPIVVHALTEGAREPVADVRIYRHVFGLFRFFPGRSS